MHCAYFTTAATADMCEQGCVICLLNAVALEWNFILFRKPSVGYAFLGKIGNSTMP